MASDERRHHKVEPEVEQSAEDDRTGERVYDSFVVRLWREVGASRLLRVEIEHAQSGGTVTGRGVALGWIEARIADLLGEARTPRDRPEVG